MAKIPLIYANLHNAEFIPDIGNFGPSLSPTSPGTVKVLSMSLLDTGFVEVSLKSNAATKTALIPITNFRVMVPNETKLTKS